MKEDFIGGGMFGCGMAMLAFIVFLLYMFW